MDRSISFGAMDNAGPLFLEIGGGSGRAWRSGAGSRLCLRPGRARYPAPRDRGGLPRPARHRRDGAGGRAGSSTWACGNREGQMATRLVPKELAKRPERLAPGPPACAPAAARPSSCARCWRPSTSRWSSPMPPAAWRWRPPSIPTPPGRCPGSTTPLRTRRPPSAASRPPTAAWCARARSRSRTSGSSPLAATAAPTTSACSPCPARWSAGTSFLYVCYDNGAYMNTGIQRSSATPFGANTTTSPAGKVIPGKQQFRKDLTAIMAAHDIPYVAQAAPSRWRDLMQKTRKAVALRRARLHERAGLLQPGLAARHRRDHRAHPVGRGHLLLAALRGGGRRVAAELQAQGKAAGGGLAEAAGPLPAPLPAGEPAS